MTRSLVELRGVGVSFGDTPVLRNLDLDLQPGEAVGLMGPNGSGKTTLLRLVAILLRPTSGGGSVLGADLNGEDRFAVRPRITMVGHRPSLYRQLTLLENLEFVARMRGVATSEAERVLAAVGLAGAQKRRVEQCSHGMLRRAEFARALMLAPDLLLLDEAHAGLDESAATLVGSLVDQVRRRGGAALVVSHEPERIAPIIDRIEILQQGSLQGAGASST
jgi:heme exporter protein A